MPEVETSAAEDPQRLRELRPRSFNSEIAAREGERERGVGEKREEEEGCTMLLFIEEDGRGRRCARQISRRCGPARHGGVQE